MHVRVDLSVCSGHALCHSAAPDVFDLDDDTGYCMLISEEIPAGLEKAAQQGADACPERAITLVP